MYISDKSFADILPWLKSLDFFDLKAIREGLHLNQYSSPQEKEDMNNEIRDLLKNLYTKGELGFYGDDFSKADSFYWKSRR